MVDERLLVTRTSHWFALPTWTRRLRVGLDWAVAAAFPRDVAELGTLGHSEPLFVSRAEGLTGFRPPRNG